MPSLPGYGFSSPLRCAVTIDDTADLWARLMTDVLGYERFGAAGGDWAEEPDLVVDDLRALFRSIAALGTDRRATSASGH